MVWPLALLSKYDPLDADAEWEELSFIKGGRSYRLDDVFWWGTLRYVNAA